MRSVGHVGADVQAQVAVEEKDGEHDHERADDELGGEGEAWLGLGLGLGLGSGSGLGLGLGLGLGCSTLPVGGIFVQGVLVRVVTTAVGEERTLLLAMASTALGFSALSCAPPELDPHPNPAPAPTAACASAQTLGLAPIPAPTPVLILPLTRHTGSGRPSSRRRTPQLATHIRRRCTYHAYHSYQG